MAKQYLNRQEKNQALTIAAFIGYLDEQAEEWAKAGRSKESVKYLRMAKSFANKSLDSLFEGLDQAEKDRLVLELRKMDVAVKYKDEAIREYKRMLELDSVTPIQTEDLLDICGQAIEICKVCDYVPTTCRLRQLLIKYDVPALNEDPESGGCPYQS